MEKITSKFTGSIEPEWQEIENARTSAEKFLTKENYSTDDSMTIIMVFIELLENAIKYGSFYSNEDTISFSIIKKNKKTTIEVKNPVDDSLSKNLENLDKQIQWIRGYQSPFEAYIEKLKEISSKNLIEGESGLGLVRIAYEGQSILDFYVSEKNILAVSAVYEP